jgi:hypothetical protein
VQEVVAYGVEVVAARVVGKVVRLMEKYISVCRDRKLRSRWHLPAGQAIDAHVPRSRQRKINRAKMERTESIKVELTNGLRWSLSINPSVFRNSSMFVLTNHRELQIESNSVIASSSRFKSLVSPPQISAQLRSIAKINDT